MNDDFITEALHARYEAVHKSWGCEASEALFEDLLDLICETGIGERATPRTIVDNYLINGEFISRKNLSEYTGEAYQDDDERDAAFEALVAEALLKNDDFACIQF